MKKIILIITFFITGTFSYADGLDKLSEGISKAILEKIPGEGHTELSIDLRNNTKPDFSILGVREIAPLNQGTFFTQFSAQNTKKSSDTRWVTNLGFGARKLSADNTMMFGINNFYDYELDTEHMRASVGLEARSAVLELHYNNYIKVGDGFNDEHVLSGQDFQLSSQIPHLHWATAFINAYEWDGRIKDDVKGKKIGSEMQLTPHLNLELAHDDKNKKTLEDEWYAKFQFVHPPVDGPTAMDGVSSTAWKENRDMSGELLSKVKRNNKIVVEFKGAATISRTD